MLSTRLSLENQKVVRSFVDDDLKLYLPMNGPNINTGLRLLGAGSMEFDGTNDYVDCGNDSSLQITGALSIAAWVKTTATATQRFITKYDGTDKCFYMAVQTSSGVFRLNLTSSNTEIEVNGTSNNLDSQWHHVVGVFTPSKSLKIYVDGVLENTNTSSVPATIDNDDVKFFIGTEEDLEIDFKGSIKNVVIWERAITATEVQNVMYKSYEEVSGRLLSGMVSWWKLEESVVALATKAADSHGSNTGTITGATVAASGSGSKYGGVVPTLPRMVDNSPKVQADAIGSGSALFDASTENISMSSKTAFSSIHNSNAGTVTAWVKFTDYTLGTNEAIVGNNGGSSSKRGFLFYFATATKSLKLHLTGDNTDVDIGGAVSNHIADNEWHHVAVVRASSPTTSFYVDGVLKESNTTAYTVDSGDADYGLQIGSHGNDAIAFEGNICQVGYWSSALTQAQIQSIMEKTYSELTASETTNLVSYWALDDEVGDGSSIVEDKNDSTLGSEIFSDPTFDDASYWSISTIDEGETGEVSGGKFTIVATSDITLTKTGTLTNTKFYRLQIVVDSYTSGGLTGVANSDFSQFNPSGAGTYNIYFAADGTSFQLKFGSGTNFSMTDISLKEVNGNYGELI